MSNKTAKVLRFRWSDVTNNFLVEPTHVILNNANKINGTWGNHAIPNPVDKSKELDFSSIKTIYFGPKVNVPRQRVRPFLEEKGIKIIRDASKADAIITCDNDYEHNIDSYWGNTCKISSMIHFLASCIIKEPRFQETVDILQGYVDRGELDKNYVIFDSNNLITPYRNFSSYCTVTRASYGPSYSSLNDSAFNNDSEATDRGRISRIEDMGIYETGYISRCYDQEVLLKSLGSNVIDKDSYESLKTMLTSSDKSNHLIAMTIMAESNFEESFMYLAFLLEEFGSNVIYNHNYRKTVAFKSLTEWIGYSKYRNFYKDTILDISLEKELLTRELLEIVKAHYLDQATAYSSNFDVSEIKLNAEAQKKIDNYFNKKENGNRLPSGGELLQEEVSL